MADFFDEFNLEGKREIMTKGRAERNTGKRAKGRQSQYETAGQAAKKFNFK